MALAHHHGLFLTLRRQRTVFLYSPDEWMDSQEGFLYFGSSVGGGVHVKILYHFVRRRIVVKLCLLPNHCQRVSIEYWLHGSRIVQRVR